MKNIYLSCFVVLIALIGCQDSVPLDKTASIASADSLFRAYYEFKLGINPIEATKLGENEYNDRVGNYISDDFQLDLIKNYNHFLNALSEYDSTEVTASQWMSMQVMKWDCTIKLEGLNNTLVTMASPMYDLPSFELMPLIQIQSLHLYFSQLAGGQSVQPFDTVKDYDNWLSRIHDYLPFLDTCIDNMKEGMEKGIVLPRVLVEKMIPQIDTFTSGPAENHLFFRPITLMPEAFSEADRIRLKRAYKDVIESELIPKYQFLEDFIINEYLPVCRETSGLGALPDGPDTYNYLIKLHTTTNMTVDEIHELGLSEVERILGEMEKVKSDIGFEGTIKEFFDYIRSSEEQMPFTDPEQVIANFNDISDRIIATLDQVFGLKPKASFEVRRTEAFREASASAEYVPGSKDATRSGVFYVPIPDVNSFNKFSDEALFLHEAIPGHHYQLSLQQENTELPEFLHPESMGVFVEGWALYAESLGKELGLYEDPIQYFGMLSMEMHRAIRLVVDTGLHGKGWTREQAIQFSLDNEAADEASIIAEIERYMATPGQALSYKIGQLKIRELRTLSEQELGDKFDVREFHNQVLNSGSLPLVLLESKINNWIEVQNSVTN
jgi:uncharacterized protein (DUF885 family)